MANTSIFQMRIAAVMSRKEFAEYFGIPYRTIQSWELGDRLCPDYLLELMLYKLQKENIIKDPEI